MNKLPTERRVQILSMLCEGSSMRSISRVVGVSINTVTKLLVDAGQFAAEFHDQNVRGVKSQRIQCDEIWSFSHCKHANLRTATAAPIGSGDVWTWTAIDAETKLIVSWLVGDRDTPSACAFIGDLRDRLANRVQLTTDGHKPYAVAVAEENLDADYAMLIKLFGPAPGGVVRYSPPAVIGTKVQNIQGNPDPMHVNTSFAERQNLTMRMSMRRFTRLTNAFSKKLDNHYYALALYFLWYNWIRIHKTTRVTPAMAAGLTDTLMSWEDMVALLDARESELKRAA